MCWLLVGHNLTGEFIASDFHDFGTICFEKNFIEILHIFFVFMELIILFFHCTRDMTYRYLIEVYFIIFFLFEAIDRSDRHNNCLQEKNFFKNSFLQVFIVTLLSQLSV